MRRYPFLRGVLALLAGLLLTAAAQAQALRTYLSASGNDGNPCTLPAPCRLLPAAIAAVIDGGEVWMIDSANYNTGAVDIDKSVTILAVPGALGSVVAVSGNAININTAGVKVALRNLVIVPYVGSFSGYSSIGGITMSASASLTVDKCLVANFTGHGITVAANGASVLVIDSVIRGNASGGLRVAEGASATVTRTTISGNYMGVHAYGAVAGTTTADITDSTMEGNNYGVVAWTAVTASAVVRVSVRDSQVVRNYTGLLAQSDAGGSTTLSASNNVVSNNNSGIQATSSGAKVWASGNTVSDNVYGLYNLSGLFESAGDNAIRNNGIDTTGAVTAIPKL